LGTWSAKTNWLQKGGDIKIQKKLNHQVGGANAKNKQRRNARGVNEEKFSVSGIGLEKHRKIIERSQQEQKQGVWERR